MFGEIKKLCEDAIAKQWSTKINVAKYPKDITLNIYFLCNERRVIISIFASRFI